MNTAKRLDFLDEPFEQQRIEPFQPVKPEQGRPKKDSEWNLIKPQVEHLRNGSETKEDEALDYATYREDTLAKVDIVLAGNYAERITDLSKGLHYSKLPNKEITAGLSSFSDGLRNRMYKDMDMSAGVMKMDNDQKKLNLYMVVTEGSGGDVKWEDMDVKTDDGYHDRVIDNIDQALNKNNLNEKLIPNQKLADELKVHIDVERGLLTSESSHGESICFVLKGRNVIECTSTAGSDAVKLQKGDVVIALSKQIIEALDQIKFKDSAELFPEQLKKKLAALPDGNKVINDLEGKNYDRGSKLYSILKRTLNDNNEYDDQAFHSALQALFSENRSQDDLKISSASAFTYKVQ